MVACKTACTVGEKYKTNSTGFKWFAYWIGLNVVCIFKLLIPSRYCEVSAQQCVTTVK